MSDNVNPIPDGYHSLTPFLCVKDAARAVEFYKKVFDATVLEFHDEPGGKISVAHLKVGDSQFMISDETSEHVRQHATENDARSPESLGGTSCSVNVYVSDADTIFNRAVAAGAKVIRPLQDRPWGDRMGEIKDPFGHIWGIATHKRNVPTHQHKSEHCP
jgi:PhnB protein